MRTIVVVDYDPGWPEAFEQVRERVWPAIRDFALAMEHVGSTSVTGLAAKPIIDISIVAREDADVPEAIERLKTLGYVHRGNLGIEDGKRSTVPMDHLSITYICARLTALALRTTWLFGITCGHIPGRRQSMANSKSDWPGSFPTTLITTSQGRQACFCEYFESPGSQRKSSRRSIGRTGSKVRAFPRHMLTFSIAGRSLVHIATET